LEITPRSAPSASRAASTMGTVSNVASRLCDEAQARGKF
jgi:hypothetical protein